MSSMLEKFSHLLYKPEAPIYQFLHAGCWVLMSFGTALAHATVCGHHEVYVSDLDSCQKCNFCCNKTRNGYITNLTPETKCIDLKKGSYLYACLETEGEDVCPSPTHPGDNDVAVTDIPYWIPVPLGLCLVVILALLFYFYCWRPRQKKRQASPKDVTLTDVKIVSQPDSQKDEETPQEQENLVEAVPATTGHEMSSKVVKTAAEPWGSMEDDNTSVQENEDSSFLGSKQNRSALPAAKPWGLGETSRKYVPEDPPELAVGAQPEKPEEEEPLLEDGDQTRVKSLSSDPYYEGLVDEKFNLSAEAKPGASE